MIETKVRRAAWVAFALGMAMVVATLLLFFHAWPRRSRVMGAAHADDWQTAFSETFGSELGAGWTVVDASETGGGYVWGTDPFTFTSPSHSAWCVGGGEIGGDIHTYPDDVNSWLVYGPLDLGDAKEATLEFNWWLETGVAPAGENQALGPESIEEMSSPPEEGDCFGWCVLTGADDFENARCKYVSRAIGEWSRGMMSLNDEVRNEDQVWIAFHFVSDDGGVGRGAFVDDVVVRARGSYRVALPLVQKDSRSTVSPTPGATPTPEERNLLHNGGFEADWVADGGTHRAAVYRAGGEAGEENRDGIHTPPGWLTWFRDSPPAQEEPQVHGVSRMEDERRVHGGDRALEIAIKDRSYDAGLLQQVDAEPGTTVRLSAWAHAWSNNGEGPPGREEDEGWSEGAGFDCFSAEQDSDELDSHLENFTFWVGVDPTGGVDPYADSVEWGAGAHIYNCFHEVPAVEVEAKAHRVTVFLRSRTSWDYEYNYAYWDEVRLTVADGDDDTSGWPYPIIDTGSKVGVHSILPNRVGGFSDELVAGGTRFSVVKAVDDLGWPAGIKETSAQTIIVARASAFDLEGCPNVEDPNTDLDEMANGLLSVILNRLTNDARLRGVVAYWEVANEPDPPGPEGYRRLAELMIKCMEKAERYGLKLALFSLNTGTPEWDEMEAMVDTGVFAQAKEGGHILALHEGTIDTHDPESGWGQTIPGSPEVEGAGNMNFRYRYLYHLLKERDQVIPLVVSEWYCGDEASAPTQTLVDAVEWYDGEASKDYYFWATCPFTLGPTGQWWHTDYERVYPGLVEYMIEVRDRENGLSPGASLWESLLRRLGW